MVNLEEIIRNIRQATSVPNEDDLRSLPFKKAFVYGRVSSQGQVEESQESIREIAKLSLREDRLNRLRHNMGRGVTHYLQLFALIRSHN